jgi:hypothetical protein
MRLIEGCDQGPIGQVGKQNSLCYRRFVQRNRLRVGKRRLLNSVVPTRRRLCFSETRSLVNFVIISRGLPWSTHSA